MRTKLLKLMELGGPALHNGTDALSVGLLGSDGLRCDGMTATSNKQSRSGLGDATVRRPVAGHLWASEVSYAI